MDVNIQLVLSSMKLSQILRVKEIKDPIVNTQGVIYTFERDLSYANYVDQTIRHLINDLVSVVNLLSESILSRDRDWRKGNRSIVVFKT